MALSARCRACDARGMLRKAATHVRVLSSTIWPVTENRAFFESKTGEQLQRGGCPNCHPERVTRALSSAQLQTRWSAKHTSQRATFPAGGGDIGTGTGHRGWDGRWTGTGHSGHWDWDGTRGLGRDTKRQRWVGSPFFHRKLTHKSLTHARATASGHFANRSRSSRTRQNCTQFCTKVGSTMPDRGRFENEDVDPI